VSATATRTRAIAIPDMAWWAAAGVDLPAAGAEPVSDSRDAEALIVPERLPAPLLAGARELRLRLGDRAPLRVLGGLEIGGEPVAEALAAGAAAAASHGPHEDGDGEGEGDRGEMMAVSGEASADGLVMEESRATLGPLGAAALPSGLALDLGLDGDVVCSARISSPLEDVGSPDPLAPLASRWAADLGAGDPQPAEGRRAARIAAVEAERALSHASWLARFLDLLGWGAAAGRIRLALGPLITAQRDFLDGGEGGGWLDECAELEAALGAPLGSRRLAWRTAGLAIVDEGRCRESGARGPIARAAGVEDDARAADPAYRALGFAPVTRSAGDARARAELRIEEALGSLALARAALQAMELPASDSTELEGPRGPFAVTTSGPSGAAALLAAGAAPAQELAEQAAAGHELARALVAVASFDLTPGAAGR
jgi:hypothetical protein